MKRFCPNCGEEIENGLGKRGLCLNCFRSENDVLEVPDFIEVKRCKSCGRILIKNKWKELKDEKELIYQILDYYLDHEGIELDIEYEKDDSTYKVELTAEKELEGRLIEQEFETKISFKEEMCQDCSKFYGGYYRYILQIRMGEKKEELIESLKDKVKDKTDRKSFVSKIERVKNGWDFYLSSRKLVDHLLKFVEEKYDIEKKESRELYGLKEGEKLYRTTVLARIKDGKR